MRPINLAKFEKKIYSQNGEDGIVIVLANLIYGKNSKYYVEFGVQDGLEGNTRILREVYNWNGLLLDNDNENAAINLHKHFVTPNNVVDIFDEYHVPKNFELLSIDIDYNDFYVLYEIVKIYKIGIIICEYNSWHPPTEDKVVIYDEKGWDGSIYFGGSLLSFCKLLWRYNYSLIYTECLGINAFFIHNDIIKSSNLNFSNINDVEKLYNTPKFNKYGVHFPDPINRAYISSVDIIS